MNRFILCLLFSMAVSAAFSQKVYFIYLQSEVQQPFYVKMNERVYSSTGSGYLVLSRLRDSVYNFSIGFPQGKSEHAFSVAVNKKDHGFLLKNFGDKGWGLFDLQDLSIRMQAANAKPNTPENTANKEVSAFTDILSKAADDPSLKEKPVQVKLEEKKQEVIPVEAVKKEEVKPVNTSITKTEEPVDKKEEPKIVSVDKPKEETKIVATEKPKEEPKTIDMEKPVVKEELKTPASEPYKASVITRGSERFTGEGTTITFIDTYDNGTRDTITIVLPVTQPPVNIKKEEPKEEKKFLDIFPDTTASKQVGEESKVVTNTPAKIIKNNCPGLADENDFFKLRKKMAAETSDYNMIDEARKYFRTKCFSVSQVKNLSALFLTDLGKYMFFDAFYNFVSDPENYPPLEAELKDSYYINRFRAMLR